MDGIQVEYVYPALPDVLWRALTERAKIAGWWGENDFVPETGQRFTVSAIGLAALAGPIQCTVLELEPERRLVMSWRVGTTHATVSLLVEQAFGGSVLVVTRHGTVGSAAPADVEQAIHHLFDDRLRAVVTRVPAEVGAGTGGAASLSLWGAGPVARPWTPGSPGPGGGPPRSRPHPPAGQPRPDRGRSRPRPTKPLPVWPAVAIAVVVAIAVMVYLLGALGGGSGSGALGPNDPGAPQPSDSGSGPFGNIDGGGPAALPVPGQTGQPPQAGPPGPSGPSGQNPVASGTVGPTTVQTTTNPPPGPVAAQLTASYQRSGLPGIAFRVTVTVTNTGGSNGHWSTAAVDLTGINLTVTVLGSTVTHFIRSGTHCFAPGGAIATVVAGSSISFSFDVTASLSIRLGTVTGVTLDSASCA